MAQIINLGRLDGTYCSNHCIKELQKFDSISSLRKYSTPEPDVLIAALQENILPGIPKDHIFLDNGSGPILKNALPYLVKSRIRASVYLALKYLFFRNAFPLILPSFTYDKVSTRARKYNLHLKIIELNPERNFELPLQKMADVLDKSPGLVYLVNPNNPTGNILIKRSELTQFLEKYPKSFFFIDEAYIEYVDPKKHSSLFDLVLKYGNICVLRTFSFAYGLAAVHTGYLVARPDIVSALTGLTTEHRISALHESVVMAAIRDKDHLGFIRERTEEAKRTIYEGLNNIGSIRIYPSETHFLLFRILGNITGKEVYDEMLREGVRIKYFESLFGYDFSKYFRINVGLPEENAVFIDRIREILEILNGKSKKT